MIFHICQKLLDRPPILAIGLTPLLLAIWLEGALPHHVSLIDQVKFLLSTLLVLRVIIQTLTGFSQDISLGTPLLLA